MQNTTETGEECWLPEKWVEAVRSCRDLNYPPVPYGEVTSLAEEITEPIYNSRLAKILPSKLIPGLRMAGPYECPLPRLPEFLLWTRRKLEDYALHAADDRVEIEANATLHDWAAQWSINLVAGNRRVSDRHDIVVGMLESALRELADEAATLRTVKFWIGLDINDATNVPKNWSDVNTLLLKQPGWETVGVDGMTDRGEIPPPWLTAAVT